MAKKKRHKKSDKIETTNLITAIINLITVLINLLNWLLENKGD